MDLDELDLTSAESKVKQKYGIIERENYNKPKFENPRQPKWPPEKKAAITAALKYFGMI